MCFPLFKRIVFFVLSLSLYCSLSAQTFSVSGYLTDAENGEALIGANVFVKAVGKGTVANVYGFYSLSLPPDTYAITFSYVGYETEVKDIVLNGHLELNLKMKLVRTFLQAVTVSAAAEREEEDVQSAQTGINKIQVEQITSMPSVGGETDVIKVMQLLPGVKKGVDGATGMYVRGGDADQNLILLDDAPVYNVAHLFGFFSIFNPDALNDVSLIKGGFPASYGGRLSSVLDIRMKEGNSSKMSVQGGVGMLSSRLTVEGPIKKEKASFIISGRRTYIDQVFRLLHQNLPYYFYDLNGKINYRLSQKDRLYLSFYSGNDVLRFKSGLDSSLFSFKFSLGNFTSTVRWNHLYNSKLFSNISLIHTRFRYDVQGKYVDNSILIKSAIKDFGAKYDFDYYPDPENHISFGGMVVSHFFRPNVVSSAGEISYTYQSKETAVIATQEISLYAMDERKLSTRVTANGGFRISSSHTQGKTYAGCEPRLSFSVLLSPRSALKASYSRMKQYMHLVSSSSVALPTDLWYPVTKRVQPQLADQTAINYTLSLKKIQSLLTVEGYYKTMKNLVEYREGAMLILNDNYEDELISGIGKAYGAEIFLNRTAGRMTGWVGYTLSWSDRNFPQLNEGKTYFSKYDRRHDLSLVVNYKISARICFSAVWVYATGIRITPMIGQFFMPNASLTNVDIIPVYAGKNSLQLPASHRLDANITFKNRDTRKWKSEWSIGGYNLYNRTQPFYVTIVSNGEGKFKYQAKGLFGFIPSLAYSVKF